jgi:deoxyribodipyrimidine photo-lyase
MAPDRWLFWHRRDLRLADNLGLAAAAAATPAVTGLFVLDPAILADPAMAPARVWFLCESLRELAERWRAAGSRLLLLRGDPELLVPLAARATAAAVVAWNRDVEPYGRERDRRVAAALRGQGTRVLVDWDQLLVAPETIRTGAGEPYRVYGPFLRNWRAQLEQRQLRRAGRPLGLPAPAGGGAQCRGAGFLLRWRRSLPLPARGGGGHGPAIGLRRWGRQRRAPGGLRAGPEFPR